MTRHSDSATALRLAQTAAHRQAIAAPSRPLQVFEPRLALSASMAADLILEMLDEPLNQTTNNHWLLDQAAAIRQQFGLQGNGQTVAVVDSGVAWDHIALGEGFGPGYRIVGGWDFADDDHDPYDDGPAGFHGTHVSGLLIGQSEDFVGMVPGADLVSLRVFNSHGQGSLDAVESALQWVLENRDTFENPITTVNLSLGAVLHQSNAQQVMGQLEDELQALYEAGVIVVAAAGNQFDPQYPDRLAYPAASQWVAAVGSIDADSRLSGFSQREAEILVAPGVQIRSTVPDHVNGWDGRVADFANATGTSMAAPQVAGAAALVREAMLLADPQADVNPSRIWEHLRETARGGTDTVTGLRYQAVDLQNAIETLLQHYQADADEPTGRQNLSSDWQSLGMVESQLQEFIPETWYEFQASRNGILSVGWDPSAAATFILRDQSGTVVEPLDNDFENQLDFLVSAGESFYVQHAGDAPLPVRLTNLVQWDEGGIRVSGTDDHDAFRLDLENGIRVEVNGAHYHIPATDTPVPIHLDGQGGRDTLSIQGSPTAERLVLRPNPMGDAPGGTLRSALVDVRMDGFQHVVFVGGGGADQATLHDSSGNDQLIARPHEARLTGANFQYTVEGVSRIFVHASSGNNTAYLFDSPGDDRLSIRPGFTSMRGEDYFNLANGFSRVYAYAGQGGYDTAVINDSPGDDRMSASARTTTVSGPGYFATAQNFHRVEAHATAGGNDTAILYGSSSATWRESGGLVQLDETDSQGTPLQRSARGFASVSTVVDQGNSSRLQLNAFAGTAEPPAIEISPKAEPPRELNDGSQDQWFYLSELDRPVAAGQPLKLPPMLDHGAEGKVLAHLFANLGTDEDEPRDSP